MYQWNICRTCLSVQALYPIFVSEESGKYTSAIYEATGAKVEINDNLPQQMCSPCITFVNKSVKFRRKCEETQKMLLENKNNIKMEPASFDDISTTCIDISDYLDVENDFKDYDDNITLDSFQYPEVPIVTDETNKHDNIENKIDINHKIENDEKSSKKRMIKSKRGDKEKREKRVREDIECEHCHKVLTSKLSLRNHYKIHTGFDVVCEHCGKKFITRRLLLMHCRAKHGYEKTDKCSYCDYKASNAEQVKIHERLHTGEKPFICGECNAGFHRKSSYLQHIAIHLPEKTVQCDQCPARFKSVTLMRIHKNRHRAPQYSFKCGVCANSFARRRNVARHLLRVHGLPPDARIERTRLH